jgi:hypothetical protein
VDLPKDLMPVIRLRPARCMECEFHVVHPVADACENCGGKLSKTRRSERFGEWEHRMRADARYCSTRCRVAGHRKRKFDGTT